MNKVSTLTQSQYFEVGLKIIVPLPRILLASFSIKLMGGGGLCFQLN